MAAIDSGFFKREITPVTLPDGSVVETDDGPRRGTTLEKLSELQPVFRPDGTITAGNACPLNDGAAAVVVMSDTRARELGIAPNGAHRGDRRVGAEPRDHGSRPDRGEPSGARPCRAAPSTTSTWSRSTRRSRRRSSPPPDELGIAWDKLNVHGGAIAVGHPFGMTGARITTTLLNGLESVDGRYGLETMCVGGGQGMAIIYERLDVTQASKPRRRPSHARATSPCARWKALTVGMPSGGGRPAFHRK